MKKLLIVLAVLAIVPLARADVLLLEDFEDGTVTYTPSVAEFSDLGRDYFFRTDGSTISPALGVTGQGGSFWFGAEDTNGDGGPSTLTLTWSGISIAGYYDLQFSGLFAEDDAADAAEDWDTDSIVSIQFQIDGGGYQNLLQFAGQGATNTEPLRDTDFNGVGDGAALNETFTTYAVNIGGTGSSLDLRLTIAGLQDGDEDIQFDNIQLRGTIPEPSTLALLGIAGLAVVATRRRRR